MEGKLTHKINTESSLWSLEPGKCILVRVACDPAARLAAPLGLAWRTGAAIATSGCLRISLSNVRLTLPSPACRALRPAPEPPRSVSHTALRTGEECPRAPAHSGESLSAFRRWALAPKPGTQGLPAENRGGTAPRDLSLLALALPALVLPCCPCPFFLSSLSFLPLIEAVAVAASLFAFGGCCGTVRLPRGGGSGAAAPPAGCHRGFPSPLSRFWHIPHVCGCEFCCSRALPPAETLLGIAPLLISLASQG